MNGLRRLDFEPSSARRKIRSRVDAYDSAHDPLDLKSIQLSVIEFPNSI